MSKGFSTEFVALVAAQDQRLAGVRLAKACFARKVPAAKVAAMLKVSRMTVYMWMRGSTIPAPRHEQAIERFLATLKT
jgi:transcriptional regulator with XRE-family HTH domain